MSKTKKCYVIPHTHWDREWRYPLWKTRSLLIEFMRKLLDILDKDEEYHCFLMDGQIAPILDYLEVAPYDAERVKKHIKAGRIAIGPWYTLPDLYPIDGECLVRNIQKGILLCRDFGGHLKVGYNTFGWGQTAQLPQIYAEFGIDQIICAKKVSEERAPQSEFIWESPDGTRVLTSRLGAFARSNFFFHAYIDTRFDTKFLSDEFVYDPKKAGTAVHYASAAKSHEDYFITEHKDDYNFDRLKDGIEKSWAGTDDSLLKDTRLFLSGCDFSTPQEDLTEIIKRANAMFPDIEFVNTRLETYMDDMKQLDQSKLVVVKGELRDGPSCDCSGNALAVRINIKQLNKKTQNNLILKAEPLCAVAEMKGEAYPRDFLNIAWKNVLDSHPHDSINGVTQDKTADDVWNRLCQANEIAEVLYDDAVHSLIRKIDYSDMGDTVMTVFNPVMQETSAVLKVCVDFPREKNVWSFDILDAQGRKAVLSHVSRVESTCPVHDMNGRPWPMYFDRHTCYVHFTDVPAMGYASYRLVPKTTFDRTHHYWYEMRKTPGEDIAVADHILENEFLCAVFNANGTFDLLDKQTGRVMQKLNYFEDTGDVGNYWAYYPPYANRTYSTLTSAPRIWIEENSHLSATIAVEYDLVLPAYGNEPLYGIQGKSSRSEQEKIAKIISRVTLAKGSKCVAVKTTVHNNVENHRMRVVFPSGIRTEFSNAAGHFTVDRRPVISTRDANGEYFNEMQTLPMQNFVDVSDGENGMAIINNGLTEFEAKPDGTVYLTLFRAVSNMIVTGWECVGRFPEQKGSQLQGVLEFEYGIYPHSGDWQQAGVYFEAQKINTPMMAYQVMGGTKGDLPPTHSFVRISEQNVILSAFKKAEDGSGYVIRLFNPTDMTIEFSIEIDQKVKQAYLLRMDETRKGDADLRRLTIAPKKIMTIGVLI